MNRRELLKTVGLVAVGGVCGARAAHAQITTGGSPLWYAVSGYGAVGDGKRLDSDSINNAISACHHAGGGVVYLAPGVYLSGTIVLKSNVTLYLEAGATLLGSRNIADYSPQPGPDAHGDANQKHLIFARDAENISVLGPGKIDGQGSSFWIPSGRKIPLSDDAWKDVATFDWMPLDRPSPLLEFYNCKNLRIQDVSIENAPGWTLRPIQCDHVSIHGITIKNPVIGPNTDGIDPTCCQNVLISDCVINTGDDAICLKSEDPYGGSLRVQKNVVITNCILTTCCNGLKFGTATRGGFENITFSNSVIVNEDVPLNARAISGIALEMVDGGWVEGVVISNIRMQRVRTPIFIRRAKRSGLKPGALRGVMIENVHATGAILTSSITGIPGFDVEDIILSNIRIDSEEGGLAKWTTPEIPEAPDSYPEARGFGKLPAYGFYCRHVAGLRMQHVEFKAAATEERPVIVCDDVKDIEVNGLRSTQTKGTQPAIKLIQTKDAWIHGCSFPAGLKSFLEIQGDGSKNLTLMGNDLTKVKNILHLGLDVSKHAVKMAGNAA